MDPESAIVILQSLCIPQDNPFGLRPNVMSGLGPVVLLAGPNGSGKTRILNLLADWCGRIPDAGTVRGLFEQVKKLEELILKSCEAWSSYIGHPSAAHIGHLSGLVRGILSESGELLQKHGELEELIAKFRDSVFPHIDRSTRNQINSTMGLVNELISARGGLAPLGAIGLSSSESFVRPTLVRFYERAQGLRPWQSMAHGEIKTSLERASEGVGLDSLSAHAIPAVRRLGEAYRLSHEVEGQYGRAHSEAARRLAKERWTRVVDQVKKFLGADLVWDDVSEGPMIFGTPIDSWTCSEGQRALFLLAVALAIQNADRDELVVVLDEPENHLHPSALVEVLDSIRRAAPGAQLWIATHSVHVLAHFGAESLWSVSEGTVCRASRQVRAVLGSLAGDEDRIERLNQFLGSPLQADMLDFTAECFDPPGIADTPPGDKQTSHVSALLREARPEGRRMRVVDYGAGSGRLLGEFLARDGAVGSWLDYIAFDEPGVAEDIVSRCRRQLAKCYGSESDNRYCLGELSLERAVSPGSVDCVVMCNVLHEIDPRKWLKVLGPAGMVFRMLAPGGVLLVVEDQHLALGEHAHEYGFLVLDHHELLALFDLENGSGEIVSVGQPDRPQRLKAHRIPRHLLERVTKDSIRRALSEVQKTALAKIRETRSELSAPSPRVRTAFSNRLYAFWALQHVNSSMALSDL